MKELELLIVEDDTNVIETYTRDINSYNKANQDINIKETIISDKDRALDILKNSDNIFDGAIVDLDLKQSGGSDSSGNEIIREVKNNLRFPVFVISGTSHNLDDALREETSFFKVRERDADFDFIEEIVAIYKTGITNLLNRNGEIEGLINDIFWNHLSNSLNIWIKDESRNSVEKEKSLLRYTILHMLEYLDENNVHPSEFYITRPVKKELSTGDLISLGDNRYVVLTPACDFIQRGNGNRNVNKVFLLKIKDLKEELPGLENCETSEDISNTLKGKLSKLIGNNKPYYHFIPQHNNISAGVIDFQDKLSVPIEEIEELLAKNSNDRVATISLPFLKDLIERYSSYYARQGSPDFDSEEVLNSLF